MKKTIIFIISALMLLNTSAQSLSDSTLYNRGLNMIAVAKTPQDFLDAGSYFDGLSTSLSAEWLSPLYAGLSYVLASFHETDGKLKDQYCNEAQIRLDSAARKNADESEIAAVQAFLYQARIDVSPYERGPEYSYKADEQIKKAEADDPSDPRPYFLHAMNVYYKPSLFGGGAEKALPLFELAAEKYESFKPSMAFMPTWGEEQNQEMIEKCRQGH